MKTLTLALFLSCCLFSHISHAGLGDKIQEAALKRKIKGATSEQIKNLMGNATKDQIDELIEEKKTIDQVENEIISTDCGGTAATPYYIAKIHDEWKKNGAGGSEDRKNGAYVKVIFVPAGGQLKYAKGKSVKNGTDLNISGSYCEAHNLKLEQKICFLKIKNYQTLEIQDIKSVP